jgi:FMN phosphatase YigB (HAD superfamily)
MIETDSPRSWRLFDTSFIGDVADPDRATTPWSGHRWFAYDLLRWLQPRRIVELGSHWGCSFFAFSQAVMEGELDTECHAVDTWEGDPDAGFYGPEVFESFSEIVRTWFSSVDIHIHQMTFDEALPQFADESVDLLHIDGYHSYEAVRHDFETWLPKLAPNGIVLFHDVNPSSGYGSATFWSHLREMHPGFDFPHNFGLGVLLPKGTEARDYLLSDAFMQWKAYYTEKAGNRLGHLQQLDHIRMIEERDQVMAKQTRMIEDRDQVLAAQTRMIKDRDQALAAQTRMIKDRDQALAAQTRMIDERDETISRQETMIDERDRAITTLSSQVEGSVTAKTPTASASIKQRAKRLGRELPEPVPTLLLRGRRKWWRLRSTPVVAAQPPVAASAETSQDDRHQSDDGVNEPSPSPGFESAFYTEFVDGLDTTGLTPFQHFLEVGIRSGIPASRAALGKAAFEITSIRHETVQPKPLSYRTSDGTAQVIHYYSQLPVDRYKLVTVDFWQTLVIRHRPAESVKLETARFLAHHAPAKRQLTGRDHYLARLEAESQLATERRTGSGWGEYQAGESIALGLQSLIPDLDGESLIATVDAALEHEIQSEIAHVTLNDELREWMCDLQDSGITVAVVSDFYFDAKILARILEAAGFESPPPIVVSSEVGTSKAAEGMLFVSIRERFGVDAGRHLHLGDNEHSDVQMQLSTGGAAVLLPEPAVLAGPSSGPLTQDDISRLFAGATGVGLKPAARRKVEDIHNQRDLHEYLMDRCFIAGTGLAALPALLTIGAMELARRLRLDRVNYVSREGALLARAHEAISEVVGMGDIRAVHIPSSRQSTFAPSLSDLEDDLQRLWSFYRHQSPNDLLVTLGLDPSRFRTRLLAHGLDPERKIWALGDEPAFAAFLRHKSVATEVDEAITRQRREATAFLDSALGEDKVSVVVDTGWRGTIQDNLAHLFPDRDLHGLYLGLLPYLNEQPANSTKQAVGPNANEGDDTSWLEDHVAVIERLMTPSIGSTLSYAGATGVVIDQKYDRSSLLDAFQDGLIAGSTSVAATYVELGAEVSDLETVITETMRALLLQPRPGAADAFFSVSHSDDFGTEGPETSVALLLVTERLALTIARGLPPPDIEDLFWPAGLRRCFSVEVAQVGWW